MVVAVSVRSSEGKTMASNGCGTEIRQGVGAGGRQRGALGSKQGGNRVREKWGWFGLKQGQRRDVPEKNAANVATFKLNVTTFQRVLKTNVATLRSNVATFQRSTKPTSRRSRGVQKMTSRRWDPTPRRSK